MSDPTTKPKQADLPFDTPLPPLPTRQSIQAQFDRYDSDHPAVYQLFRQYALVLLGKRPNRRFGAKLILERIRWEFALDHSHDEYKINNNYSSRYARKFLKEFPQYTNNLETRRLLD